jgi:hypothetical protein
MAVVFKNQTSTPSGAVLDRAAICVSAMCVVQCLVLPILVVISPLVSLGLLGSELFHLAMLAVVVPLSLLAFGLGYRVHRNAGMLVPGLAGLAVIITAAILEGAVLGTLAAALLTSVGGLLLISGHWLNLRKRRRACLQPRS